MKGLDSFYQGKESNFVFETLPSKIEHSHGTSVWFKSHFSNFRLKKYSTHSALHVVGSVLRLRRNTLLQVYASFDALGHLGKGWIVRATTARRLPYRANGALLPELEQVVPPYSLSVAVADCQALT